MGFLDRLSGRNQFRCTNCHALIHESTFRKRGGLCGPCSSRPEIAQKRRAMAQAQQAKGVHDPQYARCGTSESARMRQLQEAEKKGVFVYMKDWPVLQYCESCGEFFCGRCQVDLGTAAGCPVCGIALV
ncbi:MAG: hypothetical protein FJ026_17850 [Chloroflexi bacterium]|nr:hypothetical protein [Chloroflexota bacterium]